MTKYLNGERVDHDTTIKTTKLTKDEVDRLISDYQTKQDEQAQETLVRVYTNLVDMLAKNTQRQKLPRGSPPGRHDRAARRD